MKILVTGGLGYIGSHTCVELLKAGHQPTALDNLYNTTIDVKRRIEHITGHELPFIHADIRDRGAIEAAFASDKFDAVIHFAGLKAVGESVAQPLRYYDNNISGTVVLLETMAKAAVKTLVFSSSATVYGNPPTVPIREDFPLSATNPYGRTKLHIEEMLEDLWQSDKGWRIALLRYFNPVGAHESGLIGESPKGPANNLMPSIARVATGEHPWLSIFGADYPTVDGTGVRDYIHVVDLAIGHIKTLEKLASAEEILKLNLGTGSGTSILELVRAFEEVSGTKIPYRIVERRPGDVAACYADPAKALQHIEWSAQRTLRDMCVDTWRWLGRTAGQPDNIASSPN